MRQCPLCHLPEARLFYQDKRRCFHRCPRCELVFADSTARLPPSAIRHRYCEGGSQKNQRQLVQFLQPLLAQLCQLHTGPLSGLNYGRLLPAESLGILPGLGLTLAQYDPFRAPEALTLQRQYDFICCFRVFEHFSAPHREWQLFTRLLKDCGFLIFNSRLLKEPGRFGKWHHKDNPAHVSFPNKATFEYLAINSGFTLKFAEHDLILMQKSAVSAINRDPVSPPAP